MHDSPDPSEILAAASDFVKRSLVPVLPPELSFNARVTANALELVARQITEDERVTTANRTKLAALLKCEAPEDVLVAELARRIETGEMVLQDPALIDYLWTTTLAKLAVDQPRYASYRAETGPVAR